MKNGPYELTLAPKNYPGTVYRKKYAYEHHVIWWEHTGKLVPKGYLLHHKNENKRDNRLGNLELQEWGEHNSTHYTKPMEKAICGWCSSVFELKANAKRSRLKINRYGKLFCSRSCGASHQFSMPI